MKFRNKETGKIDEIEITNIDIEREKIVGIVTHEDGVQFKFAYPMYRFKMEWENYEEPKESALDLMILTLTNFIENEPDEDKVDLEDCKQMLEKLRAWQRLKNKGFRFKGYTDDSGDLFSCQVIRCSFDYSGDYAESRKDLDLLFRGEE